jgi:hypothetical protein
VAVLRRTSLTLRTEALTDLVLRVGEAQRREREALAAKKLLVVKAERTVRVRPVATMEVRHRWTLTFT